MKNIVSLLAVALFATVFAVGCGKKDKCTDVTSKPDCKNESFVDGLKNKCAWVGDDKTGRCEEVKAEKTAEEKAAEEKAAKEAKEAADKKVAADKAADEGKCVAAIATTVDETTCKGASSTLVNKATHECKFTAANATTGVAASCLLTAIANP